MAETNVDLIHGEDYAVWSSDYFTVIRTMEEYIKDYPNEVSVVSDSYDTDGQNRCLTIRIPAKWMRDPRPPRKRELTDEQREELKERASKMQRARAEKKKNGM